MHIQLARVFAIVALLGFVFISNASKADDEFKNILETLKKNVFSFPIKTALGNMKPSTTIGLCIATVLLSIVFRSVIFFMIVSGVLIVMFGSMEKATDYLKVKLNFEKHAVTTDNKSR